ncbi:hypothetical protein BC629DRAFT_1438923 [Irpex lacteus]|nr:hypothetical protein BC629DRAFT_1438923 [Irpex lacteus]
MTYENIAYQVLAAARRGSLPELIVLSGLWLTATDVIQPVQAFDVFMLHLRQDQIPGITGGRGAETTFAASSNPANRAYHSLMGVARADGHLEECGSLTSRMLDAWPGIHAWSVYFFKTCVEALDKNNSRRKSTLYVLSTALYTISTHSSLRPVMVNTPQTLEIATHLWMEEEGAKDITETNTPYGTCLMYSILVDAGLDSLKRVHKAAGENPLLVAASGKTTCSSKCSGCSVESGAWELNPRYGASVDIGMQVGALRSRLGTVRSNTQHSVSFVVHASVYVVGW